MGVQDFGAQKNTSVSGWGDPEIEVFGVEVKDRLGVRRRLGGDPTDQRTICSLSHGESGFNSVPEDEVTLATVVVEVSTADRGRETVVADAVAVDEVVAAVGVAEQVDAGVSDNQRSVVVVAVGRGTVTTVAAGVSRVAHACEHHSTSDQ